MLLFGHIGLTLGATWGLNHVLETKERNLRTSFARGVFLYLQKLDYRILLVGSMLPDIIDKPIGIYFLQDTISNGRIIGHTLLFFAALAFAGVYLSRRKIATWPLALAFGTFTHLVFDQMWRLPHTLFWPLYGFAFEKKDLSDWLNETVQSLFTNPVDYITELVGAAIIAYFIITLIRTRNLGCFLKTGELL